MPSAKLLIFFVIRNIKKTGATQHKIKCEERSDTKILVSRIPRFFH